MLNNKCPFCEIPCNMDHCPYTEKKVTKENTIEECDTCIRKLEELEKDNLYLNELVQQLHDKLHG